MATEQPSQHHFVMERSFEMTAQTCLLDQLQTSSGGAGDNAVLQVTSAEFGRVLTVEAVHIFVGTDSIQNGVSVNFIFRVQRQLDYHSVHRYVRVQLLDSGFQLQEIIQNPTLQGNIFQQIPDGLVHSCGQHIAKDFYCFGERTSYSVVLFGSLRCFALTPHSAAALSFWLMYTFESSRSPTCGNRINLN